MREVSPPIQVEFSIPAGTVTIRPRSPCRPDPTLRPGIERDLVEEAHHSQGTILGLTLIRVWNCMGNPTSRSPSGVRARDKAVYNIPPVDQNAL